MPERKTTFKKINTAEYIATQICLAIICIYSNYISPLKPQVCRFYPTCSQYTYQALQKHGFPRGVVMGVKRLLRCHPFNAGGYNPVE